MTGESSVSAAAARRALIASIFWVMGTFATASTFVERPWPAPFEAADLVAFGRIVETTAVEREGTVWTATTLSVERWIVGEPQAWERVGLRVDDAEEQPRSWTLESLGGVTPDGVVDVVDDLPVAVVGDTVLVMAYAETGRATAVVGGWQGWFVVTPRGFEDGLGRRLVVVDAAVSLVPSAATDGPGDASLDAVLDALAEGRVSPATSAAEQLDGEFGAAPPRASSEEESTDSDVVDGVDPPIAATLSVSIDDDALLAAVERAVEAWTDVGIAIDVTVTGDADLVVQFGPSAWFGRDVTTLSRRAPGGDGVELLLAPGATALRPDVLAYELARQLGRPRGDRGGWGAGLVDASSPYVLAPNDSRALAAVLARRPGDVDGDGLVGFLDLVAVAEAYGTFGTRLAADVDGSGVVDDADVQFVLTNYTFEEPSRDAPAGRTTVPR